MKFFLSSIEEHGHKVLHIPSYHCHFNTTELVCSQTERYYKYKSNTGQNELGMEAVKKCGSYY
jgi:transposase